MTSSTRIPPSSNCGVTMLSKSLKRTYPSPRACLLSHASLAAAFCPPRNQQGAVPNHLGREWWGRLFEQCSARLESCSKALLCPICFGDPHPWQNQHGHVQVSNSRHSVRAYGGRRQQSANSDPDGYEQNPSRERGRGRGRVRGLGAVGAETAARSDRPLSHSPQPMASLG